MIDVGNGPPLVLIPGLQGRWEWMRPTVNALARTFRVLSFTLAGDWGSRVKFDERLGFDNFIVQIDRVLDEAGVDSADFCGVSYGGLIAVRYAALRPRRVRHLVLASALPPDYEADERYDFYRRAPMLLLPVFALASAHRASPELRAALPTLRARLSLVPQALRVMAAPPWPGHMKRRMELIRTVDFLADVRQRTRTCAGHHRRAGPRSHGPGPAHPSLHRLAARHRARHPRSHGPHGHSDTPGRVCLHRVVVCLAHCTGP